MNTNLILHLIQLILIGSIAINLLTIFQQAKKEKIQLTERFGLGFLIGYVTDLLDTLGIGTYATTTTFFRLTRLVKDDRQIPATMTTAHVIPVILEALLFITIVKVEIPTLVGMSCASFAGAAFGSRYTKHWRTDLVQRVLGSLLILAAIIMALRLLLDPGAGISDSIRGLHGWKLPVGMAFNFLIGILMTMGLGNYAPELIFFSLMGMSPAIALPVMMLDAAMIMTASSRQFIQSDRVSWPGVLGIIVGGCLGVLTAAFFLTQLNVSHLKILVIFIALYTGFSLLKAAIITKGKKTHSA